MNDPNGGMSREEMLAKLDEAKTKFDQIRSNYKAYDAFLEKEWEKLDQAKLEAYLVKDPVPEPPTNCEFFLRLLI